MTTYAAAVEDEGYGLCTHATRRGAVDGALEPLLEDVENGNKAPGEWTVRVIVNPEWCEGCEEHDHAKYTRWLVDYESSEDVHINVFFAYPDDESIGPEWEYDGLIDQLREAFPDLVWERQTSRPGAALNGGVPNSARCWSVVVEPDLSRWLLHGDFTPFGDDPIGELRDVIAAEGREIAWRADRLTATARLLGGQPQSEWRVAIAEDNAAHMKRELEKARAALEEIVMLDGSKGGGDPYVRISRMADIAEGAL